MDTKGKGPHISRFRCENCKLVFTTPMADADELATYYDQYYEKDSYESMSYKKQILHLFDRIRSLDSREIKKEARCFNLLL
jgi:hypothetical protein